MSAGTIWRLGQTAATLLLLFPQICQAAYNLDLDSSESIKEISRQMTDDMMAYYHGDEPGGTPGLLPDPYYWWEAGAMFGALIDYWYYTGDADFNAVTTQGLLSQVGHLNDYMPKTQTLTEGNDDQGFWGLAVMSAAEYNFPNPPKDQPQWLALAQAVFNTQAPRWDKQHCNGGLRWQIFHWNKGFNYKNSISMACFFALGARLALYTGNKTYADWADTTWDWMIGTGFMNPETYYIYDGAHIEANCTDIVPYQWTYNAGGFLHGAAAMYNFTESDVWKDRVDKLLKSTGVFFRGPNKDIMTEVACEPVNLCNIDQQSFKAYLSRWLAVTTKWAPWTYDTIRPWLRASAKAAAKTCVAGANGRLCGLKWSSEVGGWDPNDLTGVGQQMAAMETLVANMIKEVKAPLSSDTGGTSKGNPSAGTEGSGRTSVGGIEWPAVETRDRVGAWVATAVLIIFLLCTIAFMVIDDWGQKGGKAAKMMGIRPNQDTPSLPLTEKGIPEPDEALARPSMLMGGVPGDTESSRTLGGNSSTETSAGTTGAQGAAAARTLSRVARRSSRGSVPHYFMAVGNDQATPARGTVVPPVPATRLTGRVKNGCLSSDGSRSSIATLRSSRSQGQISTSPGVGIGIATTRQENGPECRNSYPKPQRIYSNRSLGNPPETVPEVAHMANAGICATMHDDVAQAGKSQHQPARTAARMSGGSAAYYTRATPTPPGVATRTSSLRKSTPISRQRRSADEYNTPSPPSTPGEILWYPRPEHIGVAVSEPSTPSTPSQETRASRS